MQLNIFLNKLLFVLLGIIPHIYYCTDNENITSMETYKHRKKEKAESEANCFIILNTRIN